MFFQKKKQAKDVKMPENLNRKQQREIKAVIERAKKDNGVPQTAQQSIPFQRMFPDGICRITDNYYTCTNEILAGLGLMYIADERFKNNIDSHSLGAAEFISEAIKVYCSN